VEGDARDHQGRAAIGCCATPEFLPGITLIGNTVYVVEGKIQYLFNRSCVAGPVR
jgi:hypothetical protein